MSFGHESCLLNDNIGYKNTKFSVFQSTDEYIYKTLSTTCIISKISIKL